MTATQQIRADTQIRGLSEAAPHEPGGRLTLATATPVMITNQANKTTIYYTPYKGDLVPIWDGSTWVEWTFSELSLALDSSTGHAGYHQSDKNFDCFVFNDGGVLKLGTGVAWSSGTVRGTGAGTTELELKNGIWTNKNQITLRWGSAEANTTVVAANQATCVGSIRTSANGTTTWVLGGISAGGTAAFLYVYNFYNQVEVSALIQDSTNTWTYNLTTPRPYDNSTGNRATFLIGLEQEPVFANANYRSIGAAGAAAGVTMFGLDSTNTKSANSVGHLGIDAYTNNLQPFYAGYPGLGLHYLQLLERASAAASCTFYGATTIPDLQGGMIFRGKF